MFGVSGWDLAFWSVGFLGCWLAWQAAVSATRRRRRLVAAEEHIGNLPIRGRLRNAVTTRASGKAQLTAVYPAEYMFGWVAIRVTAEPRERGRLARHCYTEEVRYRVTRRRARKAFEDKA